MKRAALIATALIMFTILAGFNYLLWDNLAKKENLNESEEIRAENQESILSLVDTIKDKDKVTNEIRAARDLLQEQINSFDEERVSYLDDIGKLNNVVKNHYNDLLNRDIIIDAILVTVNPQYFVDFLQNNWATHINKKNYYLTFIYQGERLVLLDSQEDLLPDVDKLKEQLKNIITIEVVSAEKLEIIQNTGDEFNGIHFNMVLNIDLLKTEEGIPVEDEYFVQGENVFTITFDYDPNNKTWLIDSINQ